MPTDRFSNAISSGSYIVVALKEGWGVKLPIYKVLKINPNSLRVATLRHNWNTGLKSVVESNLSAYDLSAVVPASYAPKQLRTYKEDPKSPLMDDCSAYTKYIQNKLLELLEKDNVSGNN